MNKSINPQVEKHPVPSLADTLDGGPNPAPLGLMISLWFDDLRTVKIVLKESQVLQIFPQFFWIPSRNSSQRWYTPSLGSFGWKNLFSPLNSQHPETILAEVREWVVKFEMMPCEFFQPPRHSSQISSHQAIAEPTSFVPVGTPTPLMQSSKAMELEARAQQTSTELGHLE